MKAIPIKNGVIHLAEIKNSNCPYCTKEIKFSDIEDKWMKQDNHTMEFKCECKRKVGVTTDMRGDFVLFEIDQRK